MLPNTIQLEGVKDYTISSIGYDMETQTFTTVLVTRIKRFGFSMSPIVGTTVFSTHGTTRPCILDRTKVRLLLGVGKLDHQAETYLKERIGFIARVLQDKLANCGV